MNNENFLSIDKDASISFVVNKSEFIGHIFYVETAKEAENYILEINEKYKDATHNCYAYVIGKEKSIQKYSDDGEPSGTAGIPMLEVLKKKEVTNCLVIATRYFGGILLGAGGLVRAYTKTVVESLNEGVIVKKEKFFEIEIFLDYVFWGKVENILNKFKLEIKNIEYLENVKVNLFVKKSGFEYLEKILINETANNCKLFVVDEMYKSVFI